MLKLLRNFRHKLFSKNKVSQYLIYALGEVLLVIVGILIAVNLNNANERRKEREEINNLLRQVQTELDTNVRRIDSFYLYYSTKDSLVYTFLNEVIPSQELDDRFLGLYTSMILNYRTIEIEVDAYTALMKKAEYFPEEYTTLIQNLKSLYRQSKEGIEVSLSLIIDNIDQGIDYLSDTQPWYTDFFYRGKVPEEVKTFILTDTKYINKYTDYVNLSSQNMIPSVLSFKNRAVLAYRQINDLIPGRDKADSKASFEYDPADYSAWLGYYRDPADSDTLQIVERDGALRMLWSGNDLEIFPLNNRDFNINYPFFVKMNYNADGSVKEFRGHYPNARFVYEKLD